MLDHYVWTLTHYFKSFCGFLDLEYCSVVDCWLIMSEVVVLWIWLPVSSIWYLVILELSTI